MANILLLVATTLLLVSLALAHSFPYVPTQIFMPDPSCADFSTPCAASDTAYIFRQSTSGDIEFFSLDFSAKLDANDLTLDSPLDGDILPFLDDVPASTAFAAARTNNGSLLAYVGRCDGGKGNLWAFDDGEWSRRDLIEDSDGARGPYFLGGTVAFSSVLQPEMDQPTLYTYGGMCASPNTETEAWQWQSNANYTKSMLSLEPKGEQADTSCSLSVASNGGPRTPIAGFTLTGLTPSMTNKSGIVTQQAGYVLLGGHTQTAFINMSTAAVWNLPAESWSYVNIQAPEAVPNTDLAAKDKVSQRRSTGQAVDNVYSRSGHTATLSEDGTSIIILGGWVGDVATPAEPQLAILEMSQTYSGWQWKIPEEQPDFVGLYGHGTALLPGNVMITYGGWEINTDSSWSNKAKRQSTSGSSFRFYNLTSGSWGTTYENPLASMSPPESDAPKSEGDKSTAKRLGLGIGLGLGVPLLILFLVAAVCWCKKRKRHRENRDRAVRALSQDASHFMVDPDEMRERDDDPWGTGGGGGTWYGGGADPYYTGERSLGYESLRGNRDGEFAGALPGLHIPRKPVSRPSRGGYVPTGPRPGSFPGRIHPIYEDDEEEVYHHGRMHEAQTPTSDVPSDPFQTPVTATGPVPMFAPSLNRGSATPSPEGRRHDPEVQDWVSDVDAADALLARMDSRQRQKNGQGRVSPTRRGSTRSAALRDDESRSGSNLSESARSATDSIKAGARRLNPIAPTFLATGAEHPKPGSSSSSSYNTARSSFGVLQAEGPSLLMSGRVASPHYDEEPSSPSKSKPRRGWLGSLRRVFSTSSTPASSHEDMAMVRRSFDDEPVGGDYEPGLVGLRSELLRRKQGRHDWEKGEVAPGTSRDAMISGGSGLEPGGESDWDIEKAVEQRLVQVMFTVPRERLRVVNGAEDDERDDEGPVQAQAAVFVDPEQEHDQLRGGIREKEEGGATQDDHAEHADVRGGGEEALDEKLAEKQRIEEREDEVHSQSEPQHHKRPVPPKLQLPPPLQLSPQHYQGGPDAHGHVPQHPSHVQPIQPLFSHSPPSHSPSLPPRAGRNRSDDSNTISFMHHLELEPLEPHFSHSTDDTGNRSSGVVMEAQAVPLTRERPRTRVLQMVNSFESMSREGSPRRSS